MLPKCLGRAGQRNIEDGAFAPATTGFNEGEEDGERVGIDLQPRASAPFVEIQNARCDASGVGVKQV